MNLHPPKDIDGKLRPRHAKPDIGASQREAATIVPGKSIGAVALGDSEKDVVDFYGPPRRTRRRDIGEHVLRIATYKIHAGELAIAYNGTNVVAVATTAAYYLTHSGLRVGSRAIAVIMRPSVRCRKAYRLSIGSRSLYLTVPRPYAQAKVSRIWIERRGYGLCWASSH
jgi:hypothetical protein